MRKALENHLNENLSFLKGKKLLIACSGGVDSVVLTYLMRELNFEIGLAHCNFSLREKESDGDEEFVVDLADKLSVPVFTQTFDTKKYAKQHKLSTQMAARELRYRWFEEILNDFKYDFILTAHHADDALETFLINLSRGTGLRGLVGIPQLNEQIVRPMLPFSRFDVLNYAKENNYYWREDSSNASSQYLRNGLRHEVIPKFKQEGKGVLKNFQKTQQYLKDSQHLIDDYMGLIFNLAVTENPDGYTIDIQKLNDLPNTGALLYELLSPFGFTDFPSVQELLTAQSGKQVVSKTHRLLKDREVLILIQLPSTTKNSEASEEGNSEKEIYFISESEKKTTTPIALTISPTDKVGYVDSHTIYVDRNKITFPLTLRRWGKGDVFQPFGMEGNKKLSKFFKDEKLSLIAKEKVWLLCSGNEIIWIVNLRADDRFKVTESTHQILRITTTT